jgi:hypothetical protein
MFLRYREAAVIAFFLLLAAVATRPLVADLRDQTLAGPDPLIDLWTVHWLTSHALDPARLFTGNIYYPEPRPILFSDLSLGTAVLLLPLRPFVHDPVPLYNLGVLIALAFAGWSFCALARALTGSLWAGLLAGVLAAFGSHQMSHVAHLNLLSTGWLALFVLGLHRMATAPGVGAAVLSGVAFALAAQSSGYYAVAAVVIALCFAALRWRALVRRAALKAIAGALLLAAVLVTPYARAFLEVREREGLRRPPGMSMHMAFDPRRDLTSQGLIYGRVLSPTGNPESERLFPGLLTLALAAVAVARRRPASGLLLVTVGVLLVLSLGPALRLGERQVPLPYQWLFALPPFDSMRHPYTFAAVASFLLAVLAAIGWASLDVSRRRWAGPLVVLAAVVETLAPPVRVQRYPRELPAVYQALAQQPPGAVLEVPVFAPEVLLWAARTEERPWVNGIGAFAPQTTLQIERWVQNHWIKRTPEDVDASEPIWLLTQTFHPRYVLIPGGRKPELRPLTTAFESSRAFVPVAVMPDGDCLYEFRPERLPPEAEGETAR